jgi:hypothetical protein
VAFAIGIMLFAAGAAALTRNHQRTAARAFEHAGDVQDGEAPAASVAERGDRPAIGPATGAMVGSYLDKRRAALKQVATAQPQATSWAVVSFDSYREPDAVLSLLSTQLGRSLKVVAFQQRVPAEGFAPETVEVGGGQVEAVLGSRAGAAVARRLERERTGLATLVRSVHDAAYRQVYQAEVERLTAAVEALRSRPGTVFALVVRDTNDALYRLSRIPGVRLVDLPEPAIAPPGVKGDWGLLPDDTRTITFGA